MKRKTFYCFNYKLMNTEMLYPHYNIKCPQCGKKISWRDPREYGDIVECIHCGYEIELETEGISE